MKKKLFSFLVIASMAIVGCSQREELPASDATFEDFVGTIIVDTETRTNMDGDRNLLWSENDQISLFRKNGYHQSYKVKSFGSTSADFEYSNYSSKLSNSLGLNYAVYPFAEGNAFDGTYFTLDLSSLANQNYTANTFENGKAVMVAKSQTRELQFTNAFSVANFALTCTETGVPGDEIYVNKIKVISESNFLSGTATVDMQQDKPVAVFNSGSKEIVLTCNEPVQLSGEVTNFYVLMPVGNFPANDITITIYANIEGEEKECSVTMSEAVEFYRSTITKFTKNIDLDSWSASTEQPSKDVKVSTAEELANALKKDGDISVVLNNDIDLPISSLGQQTGGSGEYKLGGENTQNITIDLNDKKLNVTTTYWSNLGAKNDNALFTIKNGTMTSSQATGTWNSYDLCFSNCNYNFEEVVFDKAIALESAGKNFTLKNVTINETHDYYAMWISAKGQNVTIEDLTINSEGRGIKIDDQYVDTPAKVTLNIKKSEFKTANKAAILVKSPAGAEINWGEGNNIEGVDADKQFAVWVDEDAKQYADNVIVNGAYAKIEGEFKKIVSSADELVNTLKTDVQNISVVLAGDVSLDVNAYSTYAIGGQNTESIIIDGNNKTLTFNNLNSDWNHISTNNGARLIIKNANITNSGNNNGPWNRHDLNFACDVELNNVISDKAIALKAGGTLNNVTIKDENTSDTYAIWIQPKGQTVNINNCVIDMLGCTDGRGIKIDNQYIDASDEGQVTLNVTNTVFKTEEKGAIVVKSTKGAIVNIDNIDISQVAADNVNAVWVDESTKSYADLVIVTGANKKVEGE